MEHNEDTSSPDIFSKLRIIIAKQLEITDELTIKPESTFTEDLLVDSLDLIELVIKIEDGFGIEIDCSFDLRIRVS